MINYEQKLVKTIDRFLNNKKIMDTRPEAKEFLTRIKTDKEYRIQAITAFIMLMTAEPSFKNYILERLTIFND